MNKRFIIGLLFALAGALLLLTKSIFWILGLLPTLIGLVLIFASKIKLGKKLIWTAVTLVVTFICLGFGIYFRGDRALEEFYFSSKFNGKVRILYTKNCGTIPEKKGDWAIINVDTNHVLVIKREHRRVFTFSKFFIVDETGNKTELKCINKPSDFKNGILILDYFTGKYPDYDVNVQDYSLMRTTNDLPTDEENKMIESSAWNKLKECGILNKK